MRNSAPGVIVVAGLWLASASVPARADDTQIWTALFTDGPVTGEDSRMLFWFDGHARFGEDASRLGVSILRPGLGYRANGKLSLWAGYAFVESRASGRDDIHEHRLWQQATYALPGGALGAFSGRTRVEQRFSESGSDTGYRLRQFFRWIRPLDDRWSATAWNETFLALNDTDWGVRGGYDQNRTFVGLRWRASPGVSVEGGYLLNHLNRDTDQTNHNFSLAIIAPL